MRNKRYRGKKKSETEVQPICRSQKLIFNLHPTLPRPSSPLEASDKSQIQFRTDENEQTNARLLGVNKRTVHKLVFYRPLTKHIGSSDFLRQHFFAFHSSAVKERANAIFFFIGVPANFTFLKCLLSFCCCLQNHVFMCQQIKSNCNRKFIEDFYCFIA